MNRFKKLISFIAIILLCGCNNHENNTCKWNSVSTLYSDILYHGEDTSYIHFVILDGYPSRCVDSLDIVSIVHKYVDTLTDEKEKRNIDDIRFYNSSEDFDIGSMGQEWDKVNHSFLFKVFLDKKSKIIKQIKYNPWEMYD